MVKSILKIIIVCVVILLAIGAAVILLTPSPEPVNTVDTNSNVTQTHHYDDDRYDDDYDDRYDDYDDRYDD